MKKEQQQNRDLSVNEYLEKKYATERGEENPSNLLFFLILPERQPPYMDTGSKGAILGLTTDTTVADIYRGCMEGVVYEMLVNTSALKKSGCKFKKLNATGGGARSENGCDESRQH